MFDFAWSEIALIGVVALIAIGPKDMPVAMKTISGMIKKGRKLAAEFQGHVDEMLREAELGEARDSLRELRGFNLRNQIMRAVDEDGSMRRTLSQSPDQFIGGSVRPPEPTGVDATQLDTAQAVAERPRYGIEMPLEIQPLPPFAPGPRQVSDSAAPSVIPPGAAREIRRRASLRPRFLPPRPAHDLHY